MVIKKQNKKRKKNLKNNQEKGKGYMAAQCVAFVF